MNFQLYKPENQNDALSLIGELQSHEHSIDPRKSTKRDSAQKYLNELLEKIDLQSGELILAETEGKIVGLVGWYIEHEHEYDAPYGYITDIVVTEGQRGKGIGKGLLNEATNHIKAAGVDRVHVGVMQGNTGAEKLYNACSFKTYANELVKDLS